MKKNKPYRLIKPELKIFCVIIVVKLNNDYIAIRKKYYMIIFIFLKPF